MPGREPNAVRSSTHVTSAEPSTSTPTGSGPAKPNLPSLRAWQRRALTKYLTRKPKDFLAVATPGAGKTTFGLRVARELLDDRTVDQITVVAPTEHLKHLSLIHI